MPPTPASKRSAQRKAAVARAQERARRRELILEYVARGMDRADIAHTVGVSLRTVFREVNRALDERRPLAFFAGIWTNWTSTRKLKEGDVTADLFAFLTTEPNAEVAPIHPKAMPVILTTPEEIERWMTAPPADALTLQRPLPDGELRIVARGAKSDDN